jgi:hypothetical protein
MSYIAGNPLLSQVRSLTEGVATAQQTAIPIIGGMVPGMSDVYVGGATLASGDYDDTSGTQIVLKKSMATGTQYRVVAWSPSNVVNNDLTGYLRRDGTNAMTGSLNFSGLGQRITGDFNNTTIANRLAFQNSVVNGATSVGAMPNGTGPGSSFIAWGSPDPTNSSYIQLAINATQNASINLLGTGTLASTPVNFSITNAGVARLTINGTNGAIGLYGATQLQQNSGNTVLSYGLFFNNGTYNPQIRSNSGLPGIEFVNSANTNVSASISDAGVIKATSEVQGALQVRAYSTTKSSMLRCDETSGYLLDSASQVGAFSANRPISWNLANGYVSIGAAPGSNTVQLGQSGTTVMVAPSCNFIVGQNAFSTAMATGSGVYPGFSSYGNGCIYDQCQTDANMYLSKATGRGSNTFVNFMNVGNGIGAITLVSESSIAYGTTSDYRLKQNVVDLTGGIDRIMLCRPVEFEWISSGQHSRGFLAHELQDVEPDAVTGEKDGMSKDLDGNPIPAYQGVDASFLIPDIVQALQDMRRQLDWALAHIAYLEGKLGL